MLHNACEVGIYCLLNFGTMAFARSFQVFIIFNKQETVLQAKSWEGIHPFIHSFYPSIQHVSINCASLVRLKHSCVVNNVSLYDGS